MSNHDRTRSASEPPTASHHPNAAPADAPQSTLAQTPDQAATSAEVSGGAFPTIPGYEIRSKLGEGGMGVVYLAKQLGLNRDVALKMIRRADADRMEVARFWAEAEVMATVKHPHVVQVYELGEHAGRPYMAMEFVPDGSLAGWLKDSSFTPREAAELLAEIASGVGAAHRLGVVHRDLKPDNVLMASDGSPKVTDFGIAKRKAHDLTQTNAMMGTPAYMAPEQAEARSKFVGPQADVWSLGVMLYECVSGKRPFTGESVFDVLAKVATENPPALQTLVSGVPRDLHTIVTKCLTKEPELRYATAKELADDLARFVRGESIAARPLGVAERVVRWVRRKPTAAAAYGFSSLAVTLALVVFVVFGFWREAEGAKKKLESANGQLAEKKKLTEDARDDAVGLRLRAEGLFKEADLARGDALKQKGLADEARDDALKQKGLAEKAQAGEAGLRKQADGARDEALRLKGLAENAQANETKLREQVEREREKLAMFEYGRTVMVAHQEWRENNILGARALLNGTNPELRGWEWRYVHRLCESSLVTLKMRAGGILSASFSPDGSRVVTSCSDQTARVWDTGTGAELLTLKGHTANVLAASFGPDGSRIVTGSSDGTAKVWDAETGAELLTLKEPTGWVMAAWFSADGSRIVTAVGYPVADGTERVRPGTAKVWDAKTGTELLTLKGHTDRVRSASFSPDGLRIVTRGYDETARVWDAKTGTELLTLKELAGTGGAFSPDGSRIVTGNQDATARVWDAKSGAELLTLKGHTDRVRSASFSPDGSRIVTGSSDKTARLWDAKTGAEILTLRGHTSGVHSASFDADGSRILTGSSDGARVWDTKIGAEVLTLRGHTGSVMSASVSADGSCIVTGSQDGTAKLWDAKSGAETITLKGQKGGVFSASFSADGSQVVTGGWAGRYGPRDGDPLAKDGPKGKQFYWANQKDTWEGKTNRDNTARRWAVHLQNDFKARLKWCVTGRFKDANHEPVPHCQGDATRDVLRVKAPVGKPYAIDATGSSDPDGDTLSYRWFVYPEPGTYTGDVGLRDGTAAKAALDVPANAAGKTIHVVLEVTDAGTPPLTRYRRLVVTGE